VSTASAVPRITNGKANTADIFDEDVREALDIVVDTSLPAARVVRVLEQLKAERGLPKMIRVDNGSEMTSLLFAHAFFSAVTSPFLQTNPSLL